MIQVVEHLPNKALNSNHTTRKKKVDKHFILGNLVHFP
jgi:hypothetical protein